MRHLHFLSTILLCSFIIVFNACKSKSQTETSAQTNPYNYSAQQAEQIVKRFAISYQPDSLPYRDIGKLEKIPDSIIAAFKNLRVTNNAAHDKWLTLIFLKLSLDHLRCCHQGYEVRNNPSSGIDSVADPLLYEYALSTKLLDVKEPRIEFINSGIGEAWLEKNPTLKNDADIKVILMAIKPVEDSIAKGLYW